MRRRKQQPVLEVAIVEGMPDVETGTELAARIRLSPQAYAMPPCTVMWTARGLAP
jgi:hypothetical protein